MGSKSMCFLGGVYDSEVTFRRMEGKFKEITEEHVGPKSAFLRPGCYYIHNVPFFPALCVKLGWDCLWRMA